MLLYISLQFMKNENLEKLQTKYFTDRLHWRNWLEVNFDKKEEIWIEYPKKATRKLRILYNDAVEEALCFGWIDSTVKSLDENTIIQRFCKRRKKSTFSQANKERMKYLFKKGLIHHSVVDRIKPVIEEEFIFPEDITKRIEANNKAWTHYQQFSSSYKRIRIAYIDAARKRPEEFEKRINHFIQKTAKNIMIKGYGGIDKYYVIDL